MDSNYKHLLDKNLPQYNLCGIEVCSLPLNILQYLYTNCTHINKF